VTRRQPGLNRFKISGENLRLTRDDATATNQVWVADINYLKANQRWIYLATIMDVYSRRILGWSLSRTRTTQLTVAALRYAMRQRKGKTPDVFHTDRGIEYTAYRYQDALKKHGMEASYNRPGFCTDNAHMESFYHSLKAELIRGRRYESESELRHALNSYINQFYNHKRLHSALGYQAPAVYEKIAA
jgi:putative transposase